MHFFVTRWGLGQEGGEVSQKVNTEWKEVMRGMVRSRGGQIGDGGAREMYRYKYIAHAGTSWRREEKGK